MRHEQVTQSILGSTRGDRPIYIGRNIDNGKTLRGFNFELNHVLKLMLKHEAIPPCYCDSSNSVLYGRSLNQNRASFAAAGNDPLKPPMAKVPKAFLRVGETGNLGPIPWLAYMIF